MINQLMIWFAGFFFGLLVPLELPFGFVWNLFFSTKRNRFLQGLRRWILGLLFVTVICSANFSDDFSEDFFQDFFQDFLR